MDRYKTYLIWLLAPVLLMTASVLGCSVWLEPLAGDLTRLGGYTENDYGWRGTQARFTPPLAHQADLTAYDAILVFGDSFSLRTSPDRQAPLGGFWVDFLARETGLSVGVTDEDQTRLAAYLASAEYRQHPPRVLIYETVERALRHEIDNPDCRPREVQAPAIALAPRDTPPMHYQRDTAPHFGGAALGNAVNYLAKAIRAKLTKSSVVLDFALTRGDLFSSRRADRLLIYNVDLQKAGRTAAAWTALGCQLQALQSAAQANGRTRFLVVLAPDKSSVYAQFVVPPPVFVDGSERLGKLAGLHLVRVDLPLKAAVAAGVADVYLPNDTHWGSAGSQIVAHTVARALQSPIP
jgi:hypothetical protein